MSGIPLARMLTDLRAELEKAQDEGKDQGIVFEMQDIELELQMTTTQEDGVKGGVKFWVFNAEGSGKNSVVGGHTLKLTMHALDKASGKRFRISKPGRKLPGT